ncbi:hypothetical protein GCM10023094_12610 [Rhodococcus olei]|uniref:Uncharacterized protein n=1 Tax=Rhodococcus olei TaxID=2161675 RepID=A0ABP8NVP5_9NOCA
MIKTTDLDGPLFSDLQAEVARENNTPAGVLVNGGAAEPTPGTRTSEEIHRALFSAR